MKYIVTITPRAQEDREEAYDWYAENYSPEFASRWLQGITDAMRSLAIRPESCHKAQENSELPFELYELLHGKRNNKHRVLFRIEKGEVVILHIRHSARRELTPGDLA